ncbi:MAG: ribonuclease E/G [Rhodobacteraceae bacterium]|nr:ribonuclease E/G [Paracoccaceae bacterium]
MAKKMLIDATHAEETRVVVVDGNKVEEFDFESVNKRQLAGNIYLAKVTRVEPSLQAAFVDYGGNRHGFLAFSEIHPDYYQIPVADREALLAEEEAYAKAQAEEDEKKSKPRSSSRRTRGRSSTKSAENRDATISEAADIGSMDVVDLDDTDDNAEPILDFAADQAASPSSGQDEASDAAPVESGEDVGEPAPEEVGDIANGDGNGGEESVDRATGNPDIESVAQEDEREDIHPRRKPRARKYKIQEVIKVRQILLIQVVKEERGNKGAALTTYLSLAGRYCVLMPNTARGGGISRKITNASDRKKLKEIAGDIEVPKGAGLIIRTAGANRTKSEIKRDYDYLLRQWEQVRDLTLKSIAPAPIYEEGSLIKRSIRDLYNKEIDEILIEGEAGYRMAKDYMKMLMPSHAKNVKHYTDPLPLFARFQVESYLTGMFNPTVQLKSGGYIVIGVTEALVAIDVNSGRATKEGSIEETALKTNLEAAEEVARQLRLRDLAGLIVIDFIDMEDRRNNAAVEKRIKDRLKTDRARIQVGRISGFGLMEMSRQRLRPGMIEATTAPCPHCHGTGLTRSDDNLALSILRELEEEGVRRRSREVLVTVPVSIANYILNHKREHIAMIEARYGLSIRIESNPALISPDYTLERFKTATRIVPEAPVAVVSMETSLVDTPDDEADDDDTDSDDTASDTGSDRNGDNGGEDDDGQPKKKRRRRRRRGGRNRNGGTEGDGDQNDAAAGDDSATVTEADGDASVVEPEADAAEPAKKPASRSRTRTRKPAKPADDGAGDSAAPASDAPAADAVDDTPEAEPQEAPAKPAAKPRKPRRKPAPKVAEDAAPQAAEEAPAADPEAAPAKDAVIEAAQETEAEAAAAPEPTPKPAPAAKPEPVATTPPEPAPAKPAKPKRTGWWSRG